MSTPVKSPRDEDDTSEDDGPLASSPSVRHRVRGGSAIRSPPRHFESEHVPFEEQLASIIASPSSEEVRPSSGFRPSISFETALLPSGSSGNLPPLRRGMSADMEDTLAAIIETYFDGIVTEDPDEQSPHSPRSARVIPKSPLASPRTKSSKSPTRTSSSTSSSSSPASPSTSLDTPASTSSSSSSPTQAAAATSSDTVRVEYDGDLLAPSVDRSQLTKNPILVPQRRWTSRALSQLEVHKKAFLSINISHVMTPCTPSCLHTEQTAEAALTQLADNHFLAAPLKNAEGLIIGFVDVVSLLALLLVNETFGDSPQLLPSETLGELVRRNWLIVNQPNLLRVDDSLYTAMEAMCRGAHRLLVMDPAGEHVVGLITQSDVVYLLNKFPILLGFKATETLEKHHSYTGQPDVVPTSATTLQAIAHIHNTKNSAVGVVSASGHLKGCFSANSIKGLTHGEISALHQSVGGFLERDPVQHHFQHCPPSWTLFQAIHLLAETRAHRLWVTEQQHDELRLLGVLTLTDIFKCLLSFDDPAH